MIAQICERKCRRIILYFSPILACHLWRCFLRNRGPQLIGDLDGDKAVTQTDHDILVQNFGTPRPCSAADLDHDGPADSSRQLSVLLRVIGSG